MQQFTHWITTRAGVLSGHEREYMVYWWQQFWISAAWGLVFPIRAIFLYDQGMPLAFYGAVAATGSALILVSQGYLGRLADRLENRLRFMVWALAFMVFATGLITLFDELWLLATFQIIDVVATGTFFTMSNAIISSYSPMGRAGRGISIYRIAGSVGWILATFLVGFVVGSAGMRGAHVAAAILMALILIYTVKNASEPPYERDELLEQGVAQAPAQRAGRKTASYRLPIAFIMLLLTLTAINFSQSAGYTYRSIFFKHIIGTTDVQLGWVMSLQAVLEIPFILWLGFLSDVWGRRALLFFGFVATGLRWLLLSFITVPQLLYPLQLLHAISFTSTAVIVLAYASDLVPRRHRGYAMGLLNTAQSLGAVSAPLVAGYLAERYDLRLVLRVAALAAALGVVVFLIEDVRSWYQKRRDHGCESRSPVQRTSRWDG